MFGTIRRHSSWLWFIIIAGMIVSLLWWTDQTTGRQGGGGANAGKAPKVNGKNITPQMLQDFGREVRLLYFLNFRQWPEQDSQRAREIGFDLDNEAYLRLFRVAKAEEAGIQVSDELLRSLTTRLLGDFPVDKFAREVLQPVGLTLEDFERFVTHDAAIQQLGNVVGAAGRMITPAEAEEVYRRERQEIAGDIVFFTASNYMDKVAVTNGALTNFFASPQMMSRYRVPDRVSVSYIEMPKSNFMAQALENLNSVSNLNFRLQEVYYKRGGTNHFKDTNGVPLSEEKAIAEIKETELQGMALGFAARRANELANKLYDQQPLTLEKFTALAAAEKFPVQVTEPFDIENGPTNLAVSSKFVQEAFQLDEARPVSFQPLVGSNGVYLIALKEKFPGRAQTFEEVRDKVAEDYKRMNAFTLARNEATNFAARVTNAMAAGKSFAEAAQQAGHKAQPLPPISRSADSLTNLEERVDVRRLQNIMFSTEPGKLSQYTPNPPDGGYLVYVRAKLPIDEKKMREDLPKFVAEMRYQKQNEIFNQWFRKQVEKELWLRELLEKNRKAKQPSQPG
jgi:hypothetical protein